jgi:hypothetical protein
MSTEHQPLFGVPVFRGTMPDAWFCAAKGCKFKVNVVDETKMEEYKAEFIEKHTAVMEDSNE